MFSDPSDHQHEDDEDRPGAEKKAVGRDGDGHGGGRNGEAPVLPENVQRMLAMMRIARLDKVSERG